MYCCRRAHVSFVNSHMFMKYYNAAEIIMNYDTCEIAEYNK